MRALDRARLSTLLAREVAAFEAAHPRSRALHEQARGSLLGGVPMNWMVKWAGGFPVFVETAQGAHFRCVDGHEYVDFCLGDTGAMTGHAPRATLQAVAAQLPNGITTMLPTAAAALAGAALQRRFGLRYWQFTLSATDANRFALRLARLVTARPRVLVFNGCYHGTVDETFAMLGPDGGVAARRGNLGPPVDPALTTRVVEFNDVPALEAALAAEDVAVVLAEPALTNIGIVLPDPGFHAALRELTRRHGTLLLLDETHTICAGPGGCTAAWGLEPDIVVTGKTIGGGIPVGAYGLSAEVGDAVVASIELEDADVGGIGGTLAGNALSTSAVQATLASLLDEDDFARTIPLAERWQAGVEAALARHQVPWHVTRLGARAEYHFLATAPRNGGEAAAATDFELERFLHLYALQRGVLLTPFHNMALMSPATSEADVDRHSEVFEAALAELYP
ncbi:MAG TPA: transaminase [Candidatus Dormibacteraeota bacterium]|nr:transaminase [Candidatus Dormibacteraeota bacterium]